MLLLTFRFCLSSALAPLATVAIARSPLHPRRISGQVGGARTWAAALASTKTELELLRPADAYTYCGCRTGCISVLCPCVASARRECGVRCRCRACTNPYSKMVSMGVEIMEKGSTCVRQCLHKKPPLFVDAWMESEAVMPCCGHSAPVLERLLASRVYDGNTEPTVRCDCGTPGAEDQVLVVCGDVGDGAGGRVFCPLSQYRHCQQCESCTSLHEQHCEVCGKCYKPEEAVGGQCPCYSDGGERRRAFYEEGISVEHMAQRVAKSERVMHRLHVSREERRQLLRSFHAEGDAGIPGATMSLAEIKKARTMNAHERYKTTISAAGVRQYRRRPSIAGKEAPADKAAAAGEIV